MSNNNMFDSILCEILNGDKKNNYPPYNAYTLNDNNNTIIIEFAVAGFGKDDLKVSFVDNALILKGQLESKNDSNISYLNRGLAKRNFDVKLYIPRGKWKITDSVLKSGILKITLDNDAECVNIPIREL